MAISYILQLVDILVLVLLHLHPGTFATAIPHYPRNNDADCKCMPGDACWPSTEEWTALNSSLGGKLVTTVPIGSPCHDPTYVEAECLCLQQQWFMPEVHYESSSSVMAPFFANHSCDPFAAESSPCIIGVYVRYAIDVTEAQDITIGLAFAQEKNIRLVIRNTAHDYLGKSTGDGALAIWTHHLKEIDFLHYQSAYYTGKAIKMGAGVQGFEAYAAADKEGLNVVGGECPTVGLAGGYTQGGGHSALTSRYGMAADQTLEWEVVSADGTLLRASPTENPDLYWALSGGGGGTYGVVYSLTSRVYEDRPVSGLNLSFTSAGLAEDVFYSMIGSWHTRLIPITDAGCYALTLITQDAFSVFPVFCSGVSIADLKALMAPFTDELSQAGVNYTADYSDYPSYLAGYTGLISPAYAGNSIGLSQTGGRLIPRSVIETNNDALTAAVRIITNDIPFISVAVNASKATTGQLNNAVLPAWRDTLLTVVLASPWNETASWSEDIALQQKMTDYWVPQLTALTPGGGCYLNEANAPSHPKQADFNQPHWQQTFYGSNYDKLLAVKRAYDPSNLFYATTAVGSEYWSVEADGRLCKA